MSEEPPKKPKPDESDLSQILAHGPAFCAAFGRPIGALLMFFAIAKARRGIMGVATAISLAGTFFYNILK
jgi:hypothetical protein